MRNVKDIEALKAYIDENTLQEVCVIGGGFIGIEVAENLNIAGKRVSIVEATNQILAPFDYDMVQILHKEIINHGINLHVEDAVMEITDQEVRLASGTAISAQVVVLAIGVAPETKLAPGCGPGASGRPVVSGWITITAPVILIFMRSATRLRSFRHSPGSHPSFYGRSRAASGQKRCG